MNAAGAADAKKDDRTVFVRGVGFDVGEAALSELFQEVGPVRHAFLVKRGTGEGAKHKGFGFVQFALKEDAERAAKELHGKELGGRKLQVGDGRRLAAGGGCIVAVAAGTAAAGCGLCFPSTLWNHSCRWRLP